MVCNLVGLPTLALATRRFERMELIGRGVLVHTLPPVPAASRAPPGLTERLLFWVNVAMVFGRIGAKGANRGEGGDGGLMDCWI